jgi:quercetin dioxygenase-like cupin family protein
MRKLVPVLILITAVSAFAAAKKTSKVPTHKIVTPSEIQWGDPPPSMPKGAKIAVLSGDPSKEGFFVIRIKLVDGFRIAPHWHPTRENITVLSGTFNLGMGDTFDESKTTAMPAGTFGYMNAKMHHYASASGETDLEIMGNGPFVINYVNPKDDPSKM